MANEQNEKQDAGKLVEAGEGYLLQAEESLQKLQYDGVGETYLKAVAACLQAACHRLGVEFNAKTDYFHAMEELTARTGADWAEKSLCVAFILHQNDEKGFLSHDQIRRFGQDVRRLVRWLKNLS